MRRLAGLLFTMALAAAAAPLAADVSVTTVTTVEGALGGAPGGMSPKVTIRVSGSKSRVDFENGDQVIITISDTATNQAYLLRPEEKTALLLQSDAAAPSADSPSTTLDASVKATGQKRDIDGVSCDEYAVNMKLDLAAMAGGTGGSLPPEAASLLKDVSLFVTGSIWAAKDAPGAAEYTAFQRDAARVAGALARSQAGSGAAVPKGLDRLITGFPEAAGIPYLSELSTKIEGGGQLAALLQNAGQMKLTGKVTSISTDPVSQDLFVVPDGYRIVR